jgi:hypothetical protein
MEEERRQSYTRLEQKLDCLADNQIKYMSKQQDLIEDVAYIKATINNGIKEKLIETVEEVNVIKCKLDNLEDFQWFRDFVNDMRTSVFKHIMKWALIGGVLAFVASFFFTSGMKFWSLLLK